MSENQETSYYEIALSNRQVVGFFVCFLLALVVAFVSGVWVGRSNQEKMVEKARLEAIARQNEEILAQVPELSIETGKLIPPKSGANPPDLSSLTQRKSNGTLVDDVQGRSPEETATPAPTYVEPEPAQAEIPTRREPEPAPTRVEPKTPATDSKPKTPDPKSAEPAKPFAEPTSGFVVQVFSTKDEGQAKKILGDLKNAGHKAYLSPVKVGSQTMYRVRIGPFAQRGPAEQSAAKVKQKFRLEPWVTAAN